MRLCEELLDGCWKAEEEAGGQAGAEDPNAANQSARRAAAGEGIVLRAQALPDLCVTTLPGKERIVRA